MSGQTGSQEVRLLSVWVQYWPTQYTAASLASPEHCVHVCAWVCVCIWECLASLRQATCPKHTVCVCDWFRWSHGGRRRVVAFSAKLQNQCKMDLNERTTRCFHPMYLCVRLWDPAGNPRRQSALGHYSSSVSAATINDNVVVAVATNILVPFHLHLERDSYGENTEVGYKIRRGERKELKEEKIVMNKCFFLFVYLL